MEIMPSTQLPELLVLRALGEPRDVIGEALWLEIDTAKQRISLDVILQLASLGA